ncbi:hypothetical protein [Dethiosulfatarculus sandiegensis]|uniref:DUF1573 domain-containing protein n=1 Tax=Dethiosulfatarculus sandiegensis TaxID=1429043 RepID=A0A0D2IXL5_9BACT|nr:hypothetical protein [Dethiosulfatarculus sandiegensis]KIX10799.1 hypothetical protein X474_27890 [Dethiosulfatarculus sandiegensis]
MKTRFLNRLSKENRAPGIFHGPGFFACVFFSLFALVLVLGRPDCLAAPRAVIQEANLALPGPIYTGQKASGKFVIFNKGDQDLEIKQVSPG